MNSQENKLLIKVGKHFEANASGNIAIAAVLLIIVTLVAFGYSFA